MEWDKFKMAQKFLQKANAIHPEDTNDSRSHVDALSRQDLYYDCYMSSFSREDLLKRLADVIAGKIEMPDESDIDESRYKQTYISEARRILTSIERDEI
jgi:hypothetical protein